MKNFLLTTALLFAFSASAQQASEAGLAALAPVDTVLALSITAGDEIDMSDVRAAFEELEWDEARESLQHIASFLMETGALEELDVDYDAMLMLEELFNTLSEEPEELDMNARLDEFIMTMSEGEVGLADVCQPIADMDLAGFSLVGEEALLTVSVNQFSPMPSVTALTRFAEDDVALVQEVQQALITCITAEMGDDAVVELEQDDVPLYVLGDGGDMPILMGNVEGVFFVGTNPDSLRAVVRLAQGSDEDSYANGALFQSQAQFTQAKGIGLAVDFNAIANVAEGLGFMLIEDEVSEYLFNRGIAVLRTLNQASGQLVISEEGIISESALKVNPEGGDEALAALALCEDCTVSIPEFLPAHSTSAGAQHLAFEPFFDYLQGWLDGLEPLVDEELDLKAMANEVGIDLDTLLFDWVGDTIVSAQFEPTAASLASLVYNPESALLIKVKDKEAAQAGRQAWGNVMPQIIEFLSMLEEMDSEFEVFSLYGDVAHEASEYRGYAIDRYRWSFNFDVSIFYVEDGDDMYLAIASPFDTAEAFIDALEDGEGLSNNAGYQQLRDFAPETGNYISFSDSQANSAYLTDWAQVVSQPIASFFNMGSNFLYEDYLMYGSSYESNDSEFASYSYFDRDVYSLETESFDISEETRVSGTLTASESDSDATEALTPTVYYLLDTSDVEDTVVVVDLESDDFDTYLQLLDADTGDILEQNDDFDGTTHSQITFEPVAGMRYLVEVGSFGSYGAGDYRLNISTQGIVMVSTDDTADTSENFDFVSSLQLELPEISNSLALGDSSSDSIDGMYYQLEGLPIGEVVNVSVLSDELDTFLRLIDADTGDVLAENDDFDEDSGYSVINFTPQEGINYAIQVTTYRQSQGGSNYEVSFDNGEITETTNASGGTVVSIGLVDLPTEDTWLELALDDSATGSIVAAEDMDDDDTFMTISNFYSLEGLEAGSEVSIALSSDDFDSRLFVIDVDAGEYIFENDDYDDSNSFISFIVEEGTSYIVEASSFYGDAEGDYTLEVTVADASESVTEEIVEEDVLTVPTFAEWLSITDLGYESLELINERLSFSNGYSEIDGDTLFSRMLIHFDW